MNLLAESEVKVTQSCLAVRKPMDYTVHGLLQARELTLQVLRLGL